MNDNIYLLISLSIINIIIIFNLKYIANKLGIIDYPEGKIHSKPTPLFGVFLIISIIIYVFIKNISSLNIQIVSILFYLLSFLIIGLFDDKNNLSVSKRFFLGIIITSIFFYFNLNGHFISLGFNQTINFILLIFFTLGFIHLNNMTDGIDGLLLSIFIYTLIYFALKGFINYNYLTKDLIISSIIFSLIYFLPNFFGKCFLGNTGSYSIAIIVSLIYMEIFKYSLLEYSDIILIYIVPLLDGLRVTSIRIFKKKNPFKGDFSHIHHIIRDKYLLKIIYCIILFSPSMINFFYNDLSIIIGILTIFSFFSFYFLVIKLNKKKELW